MQSTPDLVISEIDEHMIQNYREILEKGTEWYLASLRGFFLKLGALGYSGVTTNAFALLEEITLTGNKKGWAVLTMDETEGPFTQVELRLIQGEVSKSFGEGTMSLRSCALVLLYMQLGARSAQITDLKIKDLQTEGGKYVLHVPRVKQRNQGRRAELKKRVLESKVGTIVDAWCRQVRREYGSKISCAEDLPIFPCDRLAKTAKADPGFQFHTDSQILHGEVSYFFQKHPVISPRTGEPMKVTPQRFRYTLGTRAVIHGAGAGTVAELLDHSDTQNVLVYIKFSDELIEELNAELADDLAPLAQAFRGEIILFDKGFLSDPGNLISYPGLDIKKDTYTGKCKCGGECGDVPPIFCYSCPYFFAFKEAPHEKVLELMLAEKEKELELGNIDVAREMDEPIAACRAVIQKCQEGR
ncbi:hypothetical protein GMSM_05330 [Geomonas sp. Red276]